MQRPCRFNILILLVAFITLILLFGADLSVGAQVKTYPDKSRSVNVIVAYPPGGGTDVAARVMTPLLEKELGMPVVVLNKSGAGGQVGFTENCPVTTGRLHHRIFNHSDGYYHLP